MKAHRTATTNTFAAAFIKSVMELPFAGRIYAPGGENCSADALRQKVADWQADGAIVVFTAGVFDLMHINHVLALHHYRLLGAYQYLVKSGQSVDDADLVIATAASDRVRLVVTLDSDARAEAMKSRVPSKAYSPRPILSWNNRLQMVAKQTMSAADGSVVMLADAVTVHGAESCRLADCPHLDDARLAQHVLPDVIPISSGSVDTINQLTRTPLAGKLVVIDEDTLAYTDDLVGGAVKTSAIIRRAKS